MNFSSWGRYPKAIGKEISYKWRHDLFPKADGRSILPVGCGRSYGDSCLNNNANILHISPLNRLINFDDETGILKCEGGVTLDEILKFAVPRGWFLPVTPGTKFVTVGGAIANDVHGKNHHHCGTFGNFVESFELLRSDQSRTICSKNSSAELFSATIGGLGLTGVIVWAEIKLKKIKSSKINTSSIKFNSIDDFLEISKAESRKYEYTVSWLDCLSSNTQGRGIFMGGNHSEDGLLKPHKNGILSVPLDFPEFALGNLSMKAFNLAYFHKQRSSEVSSVSHYDPFFYPLDFVLNWNKIYGKRGFFQFQCVISESAIKELLDIIIKSGSGSFLAVLKEFGNIESPGLLSFPCPGITLALDFANRGERTLALLKKLDEFIYKSGGKIYPAKDATMSSVSFKKYYSNWHELEKLRDPVINSSFWQRVTKE